MTFFEIGVPDSARAQEFYGRLFGWEFPPTGEGSQVWINTPTIKGSGSGCTSDYPDSPLCPTRVVSIHCAASDSVSKFARTSNWPRS
ncbi:hypothetical protein ACFWVM_09015 [Nocardia fluminea]|uniref:hypothetical protein n=1 Tax=Nocardia fluminea TaxID=134984 RepID=UPI003646E7E6